MQGGAMYALERGLNMKWLGMIFAVFAGFASFGIGCATQVNAIAEVCDANLGIEPWIVGIIVAATDRVCHLWRDQDDSKCLREACAVYGNFLCTWMSDHSGDKL